MSLMANLMLSTGRPVINNPYYESKEMRYIDRNSDVATFIILIFINGCSMFQRSNDESVRNFQQKRRRVRVLHLKEYARRLRHIGRIDVSRFRNCVIELFQKLTELIRKFFNLYNNSISDR